MHATGHRWKACQHTVTGPVTAMSTAFALEARRPVVVPGRDTYWRLFPSGAKRNEGTAIRLPSRREVLCPSPGACPTQGDDPLNWRTRNHTQAGKTPRRTSPQKGTRDSRPQRRPLELAVKLPFIRIGAGTHLLVFRLTRKWSLVLGIDQSVRDVSRDITGR